MCKFRKLENWVRFPDMAPLLHNIVHCILYLLVAMATTNITINGQTFDKSDTFNPDTADSKTDGLSVLCFSKNDDSKVNNCIIDGQDARWGGKASLTFGLEYNRCTFKNGTARAFDMVRGGNVTFTECIFENTVRKPVASQYTIAEQCDIGIKGGVHDVTFHSCIFNDILIGDYSIYDQQDRPKARRFTFINCKNKDGGPIIIRGKYVEKDSINLVGTQAKMWVWPSFLTKLYWMFNRKFGDKRKPDGWNVYDPREID
jgi:hypothetical protein